MVVRSVVALCSPCALSAPSSGPRRSNSHRIVRRDDVVTPPRPRNWPDLSLKRANSVIVRNNDANDDFSSTSTSTSSSSPSDGDSRTSSAPSFPSSETEEGVEGVLAAFAANAAAAEEAALAAAFANVSSSSSSSGSSRSGSPNNNNNNASPPSAAPPSSSSSPSSPSSPSSGPSPALAAKIAAARAYKAAAAERAAAAAADATTSSSAPSPPPPPSVVARSSPPPPSARAPPATPAGPTFTRLTPPPPTRKPFAAPENVVDSTAAAAAAAAAAAGSNAGDAAGAPRAPAALAARRGAGEGSATEAAAFLRGVFSPGDDANGDPEPPLDPNMRPEEFTALKQARERARGAEIITVDATTTSSSEEEDGEGQEEGESYRPRVATWGVFPRPDNISKAYGGGRTIRPGESLETEEERKARVARQRAALEAYRKKVGLVVDPRDEVEATRLVAAGNELMQRGALEEAAAEYARAADLLPARSAVGGRARLQRAICLDSLGKSDEAFALYKSVEGHPLDSIGKETKRMLFGFTAMENLKAHTISYAATKKEYEPFFGKLKSDYDLAYSGTPPSEEDERSAAFAIVAAFAVVAVPLVLFGALALNK